MKGKTVDPKLYIIMRQDLYDNTAGKMMAQAAHAGTKFVFDFYDNNPSAAEFLNEWRGNRGFGTKIVLQGTLTEIMKAKDIMNEHDVSFAGLSRIRPTPSGIRSVNISPPMKSPACMSSSLKTRQRKRKSA